MTIIRVTLKTISQSPMNFKVVFRKAVRVAVNNRRFGLAAREQMKLMGDFAPSFFLSYLLDKITSL